jgi:hypothetical protein
MANELKVTYNGVGANLYATVRNTSGQVWQTTTSTFVDYVSANVANYDIALTDAGGDLYQGDFPSGAGTGKFVVQYYERSGGTPAITDDLLLTKGYRNDGSTGSGSSGPYLTTLSNVKTYMGITGTASDNRINQLIPAASKIVQEYCEREFLSATYTERYDGNAVGLNGGYIWLNNVPVTAITSITFEPDFSVLSETVTGSNFSYDPDTGLVQFDPDSNYTRAFRMGFRNLSVVYTAGDASVPEEVDTATAMVVAAMVGQAGRDPSAYRERIGDYEYYARSAADGGSPYEVLRYATPILDKYRRIGFAV